MTKNRVMLVAAALLCGPIVAQAQDMDEKAFPKTSISGKASTFDSYYAVKLDCTPLDWVEVRIVQQPENGKAEIVKGTVLMQYPDANPRKSCNGKPTMAKRLVFTPGKKAIGEDKIVVEVVTSAGGSFRRVYDVTVM
jgi:hypothetical protein